MGLTLKDTSFAKYFLEEGITKGKAEGKHEKAVEIAKKLLAKGISAEEAAELTDLPINEVEQLKK